MAKIKPLVNQAVMRSWSSLSSVRTFYIPIQPLLIHNMNDSEYIMTLNVRGSAMKNLKISVFGFKKYKKRRGEKRKRGKRNKFYVQPDNENKLIIFFTHFLSCYFISIPLLSYHLFQLNIGLEIFQWRIRMRALYHYHQSRTNPTHD